MLAGDVNPHGRLASIEEIALKEVAAGVALEEDPL
jgi:hypothetical protein